MAAERQDAGIQQGLILALEEASLSCEAIRDEIKTLKTRTVRSRLQNDSSEGLWLISHFPQPVQLAACMFIVEQAPSCASPVSLPNLLSRKNLQDVTEPEGSYPEDTNGNGDFKISAFFGDRCAPPKTEDGTDTEELDPSMELVYVHIQDAGNAVIVGSKGTASSDRCAGGAAANDCGPAAAVRAPASWLGVYHTISQKMLHTRWGLLPCVSGNCLWQV